MGHCPIKLEQTWRFVQKCPWTLSQSVCATICHVDVTAHFLKWFWTFGQCPCPLRFNWTIISSVVGHVGRHRKLSKNVCLTICHVDTSTHFLKCPGNVFIMFQYKARL